MDQIAFVEKQMVKQFVLVCKDSLVTHQTVDLSASRVQTALHLKLALIESVKTHVPDRAGPMHYVTWSNITLFVAALRDTPVHHSVIVTVIILIGDIFYSNTIIELIH